MNSPTSAIRLEFNDQRLRYLYVSHQLGSMRAAADELGLAPSSVSRQISKLEAELGVDLVEEGTHRIRLTAAGQATVDYYRHRAGQHEMLLEHLSDLRGRSMGGTVIALCEGLLDGGAMSHLKRFYQEHPEARTEVIIAPSCEVHSMVLDDRAHIGVAFAPDAGASLRRHYGFNQRLLFVTHGLSPLAHQASVTLSDLALTPLVLPDQKHMVRQMFNDACRRSSIDIEPKVTSNSLQVTIDFVRSGIASTLMTETPQLKNLRHADLKLIPVAIPNMAAAETQIFTRQSRKLSPVSRGLVHALARAIQAVHATPAA